MRRPAIVRLSSGCRPVVVRLSSGYRPAIVWLSSGYRPAVVRLSSGCRPAIVRPSSGYRPAVVRQNSTPPGSYYAVAARTPGGGGSSGTVSRTSILKTPKTSDSSKHETKKSTPSNNGDKSAWSECTLSNLKTLTHRRTVSYRSV